MTDAAPTGPTTPVPPPQGSGGSRWIRVALAVSVALNLAVAGLAVGAWMREGRDRGLPRDMSFGPFTEALSDVDRRELRRALVDRMPGFREVRQEMRADIANLLASLRAVPFDPAATEEALSAISRRAMDRLDLGRDLISERIAGMTDAERQAFADRLERGLKRR